MTLLDIIVGYFVDGFTYLEIIELLDRVHNHGISLSTLKRLLKENGIYRRPLPHLCSPIQEVTELVRTELQSSGSQLGYRKMHKSLLNCGLICRRSDVRKIMKDLDPEGVELRRRRRLRRRRYVNPGPNHTWHLDGHDKLKPFGFSIHACIDGFSRKLIWLEVGPSNKQPEIIAKYYTVAIQQFGLPKNIKADDGTEHSILEPMHITLRSMGGEDAFDSFSIITSPQNQRIEAYWSILQRDRIGWWRIFLQELSDLDFYSNDDPVLTDCVRYCFMHLIRADLNSILSNWNTHIIAGSRRAISPSGRPDSMFYLPDHFGGFNHAFELDNEALNEFPNYAAIEIRDYSEEFEEFAHLALGYHPKPANAEEGLQLYLQLFEKITECS